MILRYGGIKVTCVLIICVHYRNDLQKCSPKMFETIVEKWFLTSYDSIYEYFVCVKFYKCYNQGIHSYFAEKITNYIPIHNHMIRYTHNERLNIPRHRMGDWISHALLSKRGIHCHSFTRETFHLWICSS